MADVVGMSDVSSPDTGKGSKLKTGGGRRKHNMPSKQKCAKEWKKMNYKSMEDCMNYGAKPQKAGTSKKEQQDNVVQRMTTDNCLLESYEEWDEGEDKKYIITYQIEDINSPVVRN